MEQFVTVMLTWASYLSGYSVPVIQPTVIEVSHQYFVDNVCQGIDTEDKPCHYVGLYTYYNHTIRIDKGMDRKLYNAIMIHELVHYLQHINGKYTSDECSDRISREHEAYAVEQMYINQAEDGYITLNPPGDDETCSLSTPTN